MRAYAYVVYRPPPTEREKLRERKKALVSEREKLRQRNRER
jgi:hypothetical protein